MSFLQGNLRARGRARGSNLGKRPLSTDPANRISQHLDDDEDEEIKKNNAILGDLFRSSFIKEKGVFF